MPRLSFVVVGFSTGPELLACLHRCLRQTGLQREALELILVDNGGLEPWLEACRPLLDAEVTMHRNAGPSGARNEGAGLATAPLVAGERVFVLTVDRIVHAFDAIDGRRLWTMQRHWRCSLRIRLWLRASNVGHCKIKF
jgi:GT2 family glycosyltransferase